MVEDFKVELLTIIEELTRNKKSLSIVVKTCNTFSFNGLSVFQKFSYIYYIYEVKFISSPLFPDEAYHQGFQGDSTIGYPK